MCVEVVSAEGVQRLMGSAVDERIAFPLLTSDGFEICRAGEV